MISVMINEFKELSPQKKYVLLRALKCYYCDPRFRVIVLIRKMQETKSIRVKKRIKKKLKLKYMVDIGLNTVVGRHFRTEHFIGMVLGDGVKIGDNCTIYQNVTLGQRKGKYPTLGNNVTVYPNAVVLGDILVDDGAVVLAGSVVIKDVCKNGMVGGNPAVLKKVVE